MRKILILMGRYLPGHKDGGPLRTIINLTEELGDEYEFRIAALDRDHGDTEQYPNIVMNKWNTVGKAKVWYVQPKGFTLSLIRKLAKDVDVVYTCGFYNDYGYKSLLLKHVGLLYAKPLVVASMGTFSTGALSHKRTKKMVFIKLLGFLGLFKNICWSVTSELEQGEIKQYIGKNAKCIIAEDLPRSNIPGKPHQKGEKLKVVFLSRICPKKNLLYAINVLEKVHSKIQFTIYGPTEDYEYWQKCKKELELLPSNISWKYEGDVPGEYVQKSFQENDVFLFPTKGENYGHVIFESLSAGCIPVISDQTPWRIISEKYAGYIIPLENRNEFVDVIEKLANMSSSELYALQNRAVNLARDKVAFAKKQTGYRNIFENSSI